MSDSESFKDQPDEEPKVRLSADQIKQLIENHEKEWKEVDAIPFWQEVAERKIIVTTTEYTSVKEIFARFKIVPRFMKFEDIFQDALQEKVLSKVAPNTAIEFINSIAATLLKVDATSVNADPQDEPEKIADKITNKRRQVLASEFSKINAKAVEYLFPRCPDWKIQDIFMALRNNERENWSERTYDNMLYSAIFQRYFNDDFKNMGDQKINQYLPSRVKNEIKSDLILLSDDSPFLICEYGEDNHSSNHKDLIKLLESMQRVLTKRHERFEKYTNFIYGALCGGYKLTLFYMEYNAVNNNFPCYFLASDEQEMSTIILQLENMGAILKMNIAIMIGGTVQTVKKPKQGKEKTQSTVTPSKIDNSRILSSHQTGKKTKAKGDKSSSNSNSKNTVARHLEFESEESELVSAVTNMQIGDQKSSKSKSKSSLKKSSSKSSSKSEVCAPSTSTSEQKSDDTSDNSSGGGTQNKQQQQGTTNTQPTQTTANNNNNNNKSNKSNNNKSDTKEKRKAMLAKFTQVNAVIGANGRFYKVIDRITDMVHFVFHKHCTYIAKLSFLDKLNKEEEILNQLSDDNFIKPEDSFKLSDGLHCLIFPYEPPVPWKTEREFRKSAYEVLCAIAELHELNIMHGDVKYSNVIRGYDKTYLIDFDLAVQNPETYTTKYHGTFGYRAPESIKNGTLSLKMDIYSYGIYLYELAHNQKMSKILSVQEDDEEDQVVARLKEAIKRMPVELKRSAKLFDLINQCLTEDPELRPTAKELMKHPFFDMIRPKPQRENDENIAPVSSPTKVKLISGKNKLLSSPFRDITNTVN